MDTYDLAIYQGSTLSLALTLKDESSNAIDLTSYAVSGQIRSRYGDTGIMANLSTTITTPTSGIISVGLAAGTTKTLPVGMWVYDIEIMNTGNGVITKPLAGKVPVYPEVTM